MELSKGKYHLSEKQLGGQPHRKESDIEGQTRYTPGASERHL